jgi:hypothetical protein
LVWVSALPGTCRSGGWSRRPGEVNRQIFVHRLHQRKHGLYRAEPFTPAITTLDVAIDSIALNSRYLDKIGPKLKRTQGFSLVLHFFLNPMPCYRNSSERSVALYPNRSKNPRSPAWTRKDPRASVVHQTSSKFTTLPVAKPRGGYAVNVAASWCYIRLLSTQNLRTPPTMHQIH